MFGRVLNTPISTYIRTLQSNHDTLKHSVQMLVPFNGMHLLGGKSHWKKDINVLFPYTRFT